MKYMKNEEAVSPVLGVILMVAITVIVATIIAVFMFGVGAPEEAPTAKLKFSINSDSTAFNFTHAGGDPLIMTEVDISITNAITETPIITSVNLVDFCGNEADIGAVMMPGEACTNVSTDLAAYELVGVYVLHVPSGQSIADVPQLVVS